MFARKSLLIVITTFLSSILGLFGLLAMTNYLGKDVYGNIVWIIATLSTLNIVSDLGFGSAHIKRLSEGQNENDCFSTYFTIRFALTMFMAVFVLTVMLLWNDVLEGGMSPATWNLVILFLLYFIMYDLSYIVIFTFEAKMQTTRAQLILMLDPLIRVPLIIFISLNHLADDIAYAYVLASIGVLLFSLFLVKRSELRWVRPTLFRSYLKFALPLSLIAIAGAVTDNLDKILIGYFGTSASVAFYSSSQTLLAMPAVVGVAVATLAFPSFSKLHSEGDMESIRNVTHEAERYIAMIVIPIVTLVFLFPTEISETIFGAQFSSAGDAMRFLAVAMGITLLNQVYTVQILGVNRPDISAKITLGTFLLNVILLMVFVPDKLFGVQMLGLSYKGAAIESALVGAVVFLAVRLIVKDLTGTHSNPRILRHILAGMIAGVAIEALSMVYEIVGFISLFIFAVVTLVVFFGALVALKEFSRKDIDYFIDLISPSKMLSYMGDEMKNKD